MLNLRSPTLRAAMLALLGLGVIYPVAVKLGLLPAIAQFLDPSPPIACTLDARIHRTPPPFLKPDQALSNLLPANFDRSKVSLLIEKSQHRLTVYYDQKPVKSYAAVFGDLSGDKRREGDRRTPEGILKIRDKYPHPSWSKFLWLDYPNAQSECKHDRAKQTGEIPWTSTIGGEVGIHGVPIGQDALVDERRNWTWGCPSLKTKDINELYEAVQIGTIVEIVN